MRHLQIVVRLVLIAWAIALSDQPRARRVARISPISGVATFKVAMRQFYTQTLTISTERGDREGRHTDVDNHRCIWQHTN
jgi:hypothetical protein